MQTVLRSSFLCLSLILAASAAAADSSPVRYSIPNSEVRVLPRNANGRQYELIVGLPESYAKNPDRRYPVVYATDGYWDFQKLTEVQGCLVYDKYSPEFIVVGMAYAGDNLNYGDLRRWELSPVPFPPGDKSDASGHAADYLKIIEHDFIPFIDREYRTDPKHRVLCGASLGGLFTLYAMYTNPSLFEGYVAATPAVVLGDNWLLGYEEQFAKANPSLPVRLFVAVGGNEAPSYMIGSFKINQRIVSRKYPGLQYQFRVIEEERHAGMQIEAYTRGLQFVFAPVAPEAGPAADR